MWTGIMVASIAVYFLVGFIAAYPLLTSDDHEEQKVGGVGVFLWPSLLVLALFYWWFIWRPHQRWLRDRNERK